MSASEASTFEQLFLESNDQKRTADLRQGVVSVDYYEDILSPTITAKIRVINTGDSIAPKDSQNPEKTDGAKQSIYNVGKFGVKAFTESLSLEMEVSKSPVEVRLPL